MLNTRLDSEVLSDARVARVESVDILRGLVIVVMALDHVRDYFSLLRNVDPTRVSAAYYLTRWVTHFCAPTFCFLAGTSAYLALAGGRRTPRQLSVFLLTRGLWLVFAELTVLGFGFFFNTRYPSTFGWFLEVIWALGVSMIVLAGLVRLPLAVSVVFGAVLVAGHNLFDGVRPADLGAWGPLWQMLHVQGPMTLGPIRLFVVYPLVPWIGVMALGYAFGALLDRPAGSRRRTLVTLGLALTLAFLVLRAINIYGDPRPWSAQQGLMAAVGGFFNPTKYPVSLLFLLMTLGPAIAAVAWLERWKGPLAEFFSSFGRVPFFFFLVHIYVIHALVVALGWLQGFPLSAMMEFAAFLPEKFGVGLGAVYAIWVGVVLALYPVCRWFAGIKRRHRHPLLSYL